jgi:hypothetical protein
MRAPWYLSVGVVQLNHRMNSRKDQFACSPMHAGDNLKVVWSFSRQMRSSKAASTSDISFQYPNAVTQISDRSLTRTTFACRLAVPPKNSCIPCCHRPDVVVNEGSGGTLETSHVLVHIQTSECVVCGSQRKGSVLWGKTSGFSYERGTNRTAALCASLRTRSP